MPLEHAQNTCSHKTSSKTAKPLVRWEISVICMPRTCAGIYNITNNSHITQTIHKLLSQQTLVALCPQEELQFLEAEDTSSFAIADEKSEDFYGGGGQFRRGGKEHFPQLWCGNGTYSSYGQASCFAHVMFCSCHVLL